MLFDLVTTDERVRKGLIELSRSRPFSFGKGDRKIVAKQSQRLYINANKNEIVVEYPTLSKFYFAFGCLLARCDEENFAVEFAGTETRLSFLRDCSNNAALSRGGFCELVQTLALLGFDKVLLYTEDLMDIPSLPYLGHARPRYSEDDFHWFDEYAKTFGIELVPCIQTLSPFENARNRDAFGRVMNVRGALHVGREETYAFVETLVAFCRRAFSSREIHLGMEYPPTWKRDLQVNESLAEKFLGHLQEVSKIARKYDFTPCVWSDMFFVSSLSSERYDGEIFFRDEIPPAFDKAVRLAIDAGTGYGFAPCCDYAKANADRAIETAKSQKVDEFLVTAWGHNGGESSAFSALPCCLYLSEYKAFGKVDTTALNSRTAALFGNDYEDFCALGLPNGMAKNAINPAKYIFYNDPLCGICDAHVLENFPAVYAQSSRVLQTACDKGGRFSYLFKTMEILCAVLSGKSALGIRLTTAYKAKNRRELRCIADEIIPETLDALRHFHETFFQQWQRENRSWGFECFDARIGGVEERLLQTAKTLNAYLAGEMDIIEELEQPRFSYFVGVETGQPILLNAYRRIASGSDI